MNRQAILHIPDSQYCYALACDRVELRLRTSSEDVFSEVDVVYGNKYDYHLKRERAVMQKQFSDGTFDYYFVRLSLKDVRFVYVFELHEREKIYYVSEDGVSESYDFKLAYYNSFQLPYINRSDVMPEVEWMKSAVFYEIFIDRFFRGDTQKEDAYINLKWGDLPHPKSFAGGDLAGIRQKLGYLKGLGVTALYLTPVFCSVSNHKYDIYDYYEIDPQFGTKEELRGLVKEAHALGIRIVMDAVFNHCSERFPYFQDVLRNGKDSPYFDWFIIRGEKVDAEKCNYECFAACTYMPKLNLSNEQAKAYFIDVALYWIREYGIDGWRLDVSDEISHDFWHDFRKAVKAYDRDIVIIGENWHDARPYLCGDEYDGIMNYAVTKALLDFFAKKTLDAKQFAERMSALYVRNTRQVNNMMLNLLDSHDTHRFYTETGKDTDALLCALAVIFLHTGAACLYYGTEIALEGGYDPDCRRTMDWEAAGKGTKIQELVRRLASLRRKEAVRSGEIAFSGEDGIFILERRGESVLRLYVDRSGGHRCVPQGEVLLAYGWEGGVFTGTGFMIEEVAYE